MLDYTLDQFFRGLPGVSSKNSKSSIRHHATFLSLVQSPVFSSAVSSPLAAFSHWVAQSTGSVCQRVCISPWDKWVACSIAPGPLCLENSHSAPLFHSWDESPHPLSFQPLGEAANVSLAGKKKASEVSQRGLGDSSDKITSGLITVYANSDEAHCMEMSC